MQVITSRPSRRSTRAGIVSQPYRRWVQAPEARRVAGRSTRWTADRTTEFIWSLATYLCNWIKLLRLNLSLSSVGCRYTAAFWIYAEPRVPIPRGLGFRNQVPSRSMQDVPAWTRTAPTARGRPGVDGSGAGRGAELWRRRRRRVKTEEDDRRSLEAFSVAAHGWNEILWNQLQRESGPLEGDKPSDLERTDQVATHHCSKWTVFLWTLCYEEVGYGLRNEIQNPIHCLSRAGFFGLNGPMRFIKKNTPFQLLAQPIPISSRTHINQF